jgi:protein-S-isoprenylcysteine O-methyltransferase Ste14
VLWGALGLSGFIYAVVTTRRMQRQTAYKPEFEDWLFHAVLPFVAYVMLLVCALAARSHAYEASYGVSAAAMLLLFIGIHNAWDAVTYHVFVQRRKQQEAERKAPAM